MINMLGVIIVLGLLLRAVNINQSLWIDEATSVLTARDLSFNEILTKFSPGDFHPPLYYLMLKVWVGIFGVSEIGARSMSVVFGIATIPIVFLIGRRLFDRRVGLVAALFLATAPLHIYYSQEARMYVPAAFFAALFVWFFLKNSLPGLIISGLLLIYTNYLPVFLIFTFATFLIIFERERIKKEKRIWLLFVFITALFFVPWLPIFIKQLSGGLSVESSSPGWWQVLGKTSIKELLLVPVKFMIGRISSYDKSLYVGLVGVPAAIFGLLFLQAFKGWNKTKLLWFWLVGPIALTAIFGLFVSWFSYFRLLFVLPAFYLLLAVGSLSLDGKWKKLAVISVLLVNVTATGIYLFNPRFHREDWRDAVAFVESSAQGQTASFFVGSGQQEAYKFYAKSISAYSPQDLSDNFDTIWLFRYAQPIFDPGDTLRKNVEQMGYTKVQERDFNGVVVWKYENRH